MKSVLKKGNKQPNPNKPRRWNAVAKRVCHLDKILGVEVGVYKGTMSKGLLETLPQLNLDLVDRYIVTPPGDSYFDGSIKLARMSQQEFDSAFQDAKDNVVRFANRCTFYIMESREASKHIPNGSRDFIFIDADHSFIGVTNDLTYWVPKVKPGGWICGHDYAHPDQGEVKRAVEEFFTKEQLGRLQLDVQKTWFIQL